MGNEPVLSVAAVTAAVIAVAGLVAFDVDPSAVEAVVYVVFAAVGAVVARSKVTPV